MITTLELTRRMGITPQAFHDAVLPLLRRQNLLQEFEAGPALVSDSVAAELVRFAKNKEPYQRWSSVILPHHSEIPLPVHFRSRADEGHATLEIEAHLCHHCGRIWHGETEEIVEVYRDDLDKDGMHWRTMARYTVESYESKSACTECAGL